MMAGCNNPTSTETSPDRPLIIEHVITSDQYLNNRFFKLDLAGTDLPGKEPDQVIDPFSIKVFQRVTGGEMETGDISNVAAYLDTTGIFWSTPECPPNDFQTPAVVGDLWRELYFEVRMDLDGKIECLDFGEELPSESVLAVIYEILFSDIGETDVFVGDRPGRDEDDRVSIPGEDGLFYRMKLLKAPESLMPLDSFHYVMRNYYDLGYQNIDPEYFDLTLQRIDESLRPYEDESGQPYIQLFGLDQSQWFDLSPVPDGLPDLNDPAIFDLVRGLVKFPMEHPFSAGEATYRNFVGDSSFVWDGTYLSENQAPELYDPAVIPANYPNYGYFRIRLSYCEECAVLGVISVWPERSPS
jgi:hypothetical protein